MPKDIAQNVGVSQMAVSKFLDCASAADLVVYTQREPPRRTLDYVPPSWVDLVITEEKEELEKQDAKCQPNEQKPKTAQNELSDNIIGGKKE